jgi:uncharacterized protein involved in exopolysaccharide biosynthesis
MATAHNKAFNTANATIVKRAKLPDERTRPNMNMKGMALFHLSRG